MRICLIASVRFPISEPFMGGLEAHTHALARALVLRGHDVSVFAAAGSDPDLGVRELPVAAFASSPAARADVGSGPEDWMREHHAYLDLMLSLGRGAHGPFDVVHSNSLHHLPVALSHLVASPVLTTLHTPPIAWLESAIPYAAANCAFVSVSAHVSQRWRSVVESEVVYNGVDTEFWSFGDGGGPVLWSGRTVPEKAPHEAIAAACRAGLPIEVAGPIHDPAYFRERVQPLLGPGVTFLGHLDAKTLHRHVSRAAAVAVTPAWDEPFGLVAAEALSCGTPVAGYARGALPEVVDDRTGCLVAPGDVGGLGQALRSAVLLDRSAARVRALELWDRDTMVSAYEKVYSELGRLRGAA